jgi:Na+-driven multidrug efflux pump
VYGVLTGGIFSAVVWLNLPFLVGLLGASGETLDLAVGYLRIIIPTLPLLLVGMVGGAILRAHGAARLAMMATIWGGLVNAVLDPILIFGLDLELTGAALASVAARITIAASRFCRSCGTTAGSCGPTCRPERGLPARSSRWPCPRS